jgi:hypothetical protein
MSSLLGFLYVLPAPAQIVEELIRLLRRRPVTGIARIYTFNAGDFASFPEFAVLF